jgi:hypothetical protein
MEYKKGHKIKPKETLTNGVVIFTDGTNDVSPNQISCEAYGYKWNRANNTCYGFSSNFKIHKLFKNTTNRIIGAENVTERATGNTFINGNKNRTKGNNRNLLICGESHQVESGISNASVIGGKMAKVLRQGEVVIGGGSLVAGYSQMSFLQLEGRTSDNTQTALGIQGISTETEIILQPNSITGFEVYLTRLETGGESGTAGNYSYRSLRFAVKVNNAGTATISAITVKNIAKIGVNGSYFIVASSNSITIEIQDRNNVNNSWHACLYMHEIATNITF